jgi:hypothetical protein
MGPGHKTTTMLQLEVVIYFLLLWKYLSHKNEVSVENET